VSAAACWSWPALRLGRLPRRVAVQFGKRIYVLHAFQKKSKTGIATPQRDVDLIKKRYAEAQELAREHEKTKKD
jgi:Phage derived protein Gp49-like (DUF891)